MFSVAAREFLLGGFFTLKKLVVLIRPLLRTEICTTIHYKLQYFKVKLILLSFLDVN